MASQISQWKPPVQKGRRSFDDQDFVSSVTTQFSQKGTLSDRQIAALLKVLTNYQDQIPQFQQRLEALGLEAAPAYKKEPPKEIDEVCPECGAKLVLRHSRRGSFIGCSAYPKCKFIKKNNG